MLLRKLTCIFILATIFLAGTQAFAVNKAAHRADFVSAGSEWAMERSDYSRSVFNEVPVSFGKRFGGQWMVRKYGPTGDFISMWGEGIQYGQSVMNDDSAAQYAAAAFLESNSSLLPRGILFEDLEPLANVYADDTRYVSFRQTIRGIPVLKASAYVIFKHGRLVMFGLRLLPVEKEINIAPRLDLADAERIAADKLLSRSGVKAVSRGGELVVFPLVLQDNVTYRLAYAVKLNAGPEGSFSSYVDADDGALLAMRDERVFLNGTANIRHYQRNPSSSLVNDAASGVKVTTGSATGYISESGQFDVLGSSSFDLSLSGRYITIYNQAGSAITENVTGWSNGQTYNWSESTEYNLAQINAYAFVEKVRQYAYLMNQNVGWLTDNITTYVNTNDVCNAFFDPETGEMNFYRAGEYSGYECNNTALVADVVYHEFGHGFHWYSSVAGVGSFDAAVSEGLADFTSACITGDSRMAPYFYTSGEHLRDIEPDKVWPDDAAEDEHVTGLIMGGALWDMRKALRAALGGTQGDSEVRRIHAGIARTAQGMESTYEAALLADDDNGNLADGTPHFCLIYGAFSAHGLVGENTATLFVEHQPVTNYANPGHGIPISADVSAANLECSESAVGSVKVKYSLNGGSSWSSVNMSASGTHYTAAIPEQPYGTLILYRIEVQDSSTGNVIVKPGNPAAPYYYLYVGGLT